MNSTFTYSNTVKTRIIHKYITIKIVKISAEFMLSVMHSSDPKDVTIRERKTNIKINYE